MIYIIKLAGKKRINKILIKKDEISKYSAIPPHTPDIDLSFEDFLKFLFNANPPCKKIHTTIILNILILVLDLTHVLSVLCLISFSFFNIVPKCINSGL